MDDAMKILVAPGSTIRETIAVIDSVALQIALVVDEEKRLLGTVTDGDIRRGLLKGETLESPVKRVMYQDCVTVFEGETEEKVLALMKKKAVHQVPVLDHQRRVTHLHLLEEILAPKNLPNTVVLMAGGMGKRLRPLTEDCPKPMLPICGKPMLEILVEQCIDAGFKNFFISVNYLKEQIIEHFGSGERWGVDIQYIEEETPLGTAGSLTMLPGSQRHPVLIMNGDVLTRVDFSRLIDFHQEQGATATVCVREYETQIPFGVIQMNGVRVQDLEEKPVISHYVNAGMYVVNPGLIGEIPRGVPYDMPDLLGTAVKQQQVVNAFPVHEYWKDVGHIETLNQATQEWDS